MKKTLTFLMIALCANMSFAQDASENDIKNFRFGVKLTPSLNWYKPESKKLEKDGVVPKLSGGVTAEYKLGKNVSWGFGLEFTGDGGKLAYNDTANYFIADEEIISVADTSGRNGKYDLLKLNERKYNVVYFQIPMNLKMKTKEIGMLTYYAQVGVNTYIRKSAKANDKVLSYKTLQAVEESDLDVKKEVTPVKFSANAAIGGEYNLAGTTSLFFSLGFDYGLTNALKKDSEYLFRTRTNNYAPVDQKAISSAIQLSVGVLF
jgi:hypothetical protein